MLKVIHEFLTSHEDSEIIFSYNQERKNVEVTMRVDGSYFIGKMYDLGRLILDSEHFDEIFMQSLEKMYREIVKRRESYNEYLFRTNVWHTS